MGDDYERFTALAGPPDLEAGVTEMLAGGREVVPLICRRPHLAEPPTTPIDNHHSPAGSEDSTDLVHCAVTGELVVRVDCEGTVEFVILERKIANAGSDGRYIRLHTPLMIAVVHLGLHVDRIHVARGYGDTLGVESGPGAEICDRRVWRRVNEREKLFF